MKNIHFQMFYVRHQWMQCKFVHPVFLLINCKGAILGKLSQDIHESMQYIMYKYKWQMYQIYTLLYIYIFPKIKTQQESQNCPNWAKKGFILEKVHGKVFVQIVCIVQVVCIVYIVSSVCIVCIVGIVPISLFVKLEIICFGFGMVYLVFGLFGVWCWCQLVAQTCNG